MLVSVLVSPDCVEQETEIIFDASEITFVTGLFEVKTRGCVFDQCPVQIFLSIFRGGESPKDEPVLDVKTALKSVILTSLNQRGSLVIKAQRLLQSLCPLFDNAGTNEKHCFQL